MSFSHNILVKDKTGDYHVIFIIVAVFDYIVVLHFKHPEFLFITKKSNSRLSLLQQVMKFTRGQARVGKLFVREYQKSNRNMDKIKALKALVWHLSREPIYGIENLKKKNNDNI